MATSTKLTDRTIELAKQQAQIADTAEDLRRALAVLLPAETGVAQDTAARVLSIGLATLKRYQTRMHRQAHGRVPACKPRGGRHNQTVTLEFERQYFSEWVERAKQGGVVVVKQLREQMQQRAGRRIPLYTLYRMLARHGWRKVEPDTRHPQSDPMAQAAFKKNSGAGWLPPIEAIGNGSLSA
jgi:transposase